MRRLALGTLAALAACESAFVPPLPYPPPPPGPASVTVTPDSAAVITDDTLRLGAVVRDSAGNPLPGSAVRWIATDTTIVTVVNQLGTVRGQRPGSTTVRALAGTASGQVTVFVTPLVFGAISAGANHACAIANNHHAYCWGDNHDAEIGTGAASFVEPVPRRVAMATPVTAVSAGGASTCALDGTGRALCWGRAANGRLGRDGDPGDPAAPTPVLTGLSLSSLSNGGAHACSLTPAEQAACWGAGSAGQLGSGTIDRNTPTLVGDFLWSTIAAGSLHTCALATDWTAACWGANDHGQLGDTTTVNRSVPTAVRGGLRFMAIAAGGAHTCALTFAGAAYCWGRNVDGESGSGLPDTTLVTPAPVGGGLVFLSVTAGGHHTCGIAADSLAYCWGENGSGQLGDSSQLQRPAPVPVKGGLHFADLRAGAGFTCGLTGGLVVFCWGDGTQGQLGRTTLGSSTVPVRVAGQ
jgi:alpha-tubulin suppressor-like RCC1 family protein